MVVRNPYSGPVYGDGPIPAVTYSTGAADNMRKAARTAIGLANAMQDRLDMEAKVQGSEAGYAAGMSGRPELQTWGTLRGQAFNNAALSAYGAKVDIAASEQAAKIYAQNSRNPTALKAKLKGYEAGQVQELTNLSPEAASLFSTRWAAKTAAYLEKARENNFQDVKDENDALLERHEATSNMEIDALAPDLFSDNPQVSAAASMALEQIGQERMGFLTKTIQDPLLGDENTPAPIKAFDGAFLDASKKTGVDVKLLQAISWNESRGKINAKSEVGAVGMMQVMPATAKDPGFGVSPMQDQTPEENIRFGSDYFKAMLDRYQGDTEAALIAYNAGPDNADKFLQSGRNYKVLPKPGETKPYVKNVLQTYGAFLGETGVPMYSRVEVERAQQALYDKTMSAAWKGYFRRRDDKLAQYQQFTAGETKLRVYDDNGQVKEIDVRAQLSAKALAEVENWMQQEITFGNSQADREDRLQREKANRETQQTEFDYAMRMNAQGQTDAKGDPLAVTDDNGLVLEPVSAEDLNRAIYDRRLDPSVGSSMLASLNVARPATSDAGVKADLMRRMHEGEDIRPALMSNLASLNRDDFATLYSENTFKNVAEGPKLNDEQSFFYNKLEQNIMPDPAIAVTDSSAPIRLTNAQIEFRRRVQDGEKAEYVYNDLNERAASQARLDGVNSLKMLVQPRFAVMDGAPVQGGVNVPNTAQALFNAYNAKKITDQEFERQKALLKQWDEKQRALVAIPEKTPSKVKD